MPHQLRRIIGINIRNPREGGPSSRIAVMDPRGGVLAVGENGVGKTTFLRLLPLFYGATVPQILRGTGRSAMIAHTLPDASSAVAFEYERESEEDLRMVVMHCRPAEDSPQFHILTCGFREELFYDSSRQFVPREDFKARAEEFGVEVSQKLFLHQYRAVILSEQLATKEGRELRRLSALHSLGPKPLRHLNQIAAAMANEKISFRDMQQIVIDRVSDSTYDGSYGTSEASQRTLKQNRSDVGRWVTDHAHLAKVMKQEPQARAMLDRVAKVRGHHIALCGLHAVVQDAKDQATRELAQVAEREQRLQVEFGNERAELDERMKVVMTDIEVADAAAAAKRAEVQSADAQERSFAAMDAPHLVAEQDQEDSLRARIASESAELRPLEAQAGALLTTLDARVAELNSAQSAEVARINDRLRQTIRDSADRANELATAKDHAFDALETPARLDEIVQERQTLATKQGALEAMIRRPQENDATRDALLLSRVKYAEMDAILTGAASAARDAVAREAATIALRDQALERVRGADDALQRNGDAIAVTQARLSPPKGSLLEFLRAAEPSAWADAAKVIDPALLERIDLEPRLTLEPSGLEHAGDVVLNSLLMNVAEVAKPGWIDSAEVRAKLDALMARRKEMDAELVELRSAAAKAGRAYRDAEAATARARANELVAQQGFDNAKQTVVRTETSAKREREENAALATTQRADLLDKLERLGVEAESVRDGMQGRKQALRLDFDAQKRRLTEELALAEARLKEEVRRAEERREAQERRLRDDSAREFAGLGIDDSRLVALRQSIALARQRLAAIAANYHHVAAWRHFLRDVAPTMEAARTELAVRERRGRELGDRKRALQIEIEKLEDRARHAFLDIERARRARAEELESLQALLQGDLRHYSGVAPSSPEVDWFVDKLTMKVREHLRAIEDEQDALRKEYRQLRDLMASQAGAIADWVDQKEREVEQSPNRLDNEKLRDTARSLADWFQPSEYGPYVDAMNRSMQTYFAIAATFVQGLENFDHRVKAFNAELQRALSETATFARFKDLSVTVRSGVGNIAYLGTLRAMRDIANSSTSTMRTFVTQDRTMPPEAEVQLMRQFRDLLPEDGVFRVNLPDQVRLECSLTENNKPQVITNEEEFRAVSSNGNTALITAVFLMGFVQMIRGPDSPVRLTWVTDEVGRFDAGNLQAFLQTLDAHKIDVISASPSIDPELARHFPRLCIFEPNGAIDTCVLGAALEEAYVQA